MAYLLTYWPKKHRRNLLAHHDNGTCHTSGKFLDNQTRYSRAQAALWLEIRRLPLVASVARSDLKEKNLRFDLGVLRGVLFYKTIGKSLSNR